MHLSTSRFLILLITLSWQTLAQSPFSYGSEGSKIISPDHPLLSQEITFEQNSFTEGANENWTLRNPQKISEYIWDLIHLSDNVVVGVGSLGTVIRSTDGGITWNVIPTEFSITVTGISARDANNLAIVGNTGFFALSSDQGLTWTVKPTGTTQNLTGVSYFPNNRIVVGGVAKTILSSADLGNTWTPLALPDSVVSNPTARTTWAYQKIVYTSVDTFFVGVDGTGMPIQVLRTTDAGATFTAVVAAGISTPSSTTGLGMQGISFAADKLTGYGSYRTGLAGNVIKTTDGGVTWARLITAFNPLPSPSLYTTQTVQIRYNIAVSSNGQNIVTGGLFGQVLASTDFGATWSEIFGGVRHGYRDYFSGGFRSVSIAPNGSWLAAGNWGLIIGAPSFGADITFRNGSSLPITLRDIAFANNNIGFAVGFQQAEEYINAGGTTAALAIAAYYKTTDAGLTWNREDGPGRMNFRWNSVKADPSGKVWVAGLTVDGSNTTGIIKHSTDFGNTWVVQAVAPSELASLKKLDNSHLAAVSFTTTLLLTSNGGSNWSTLTVPVPNAPNSGLFDIEYLSPSELIASTGHSSASQVGHILKSTNAGATWVSKFNQATARFRSVNFIDAKVGYAVGVYGATLSRKSMIRSIDGGETWSELITPTTSEMISVLLLNKSHVMTIGASNIHYVSLNGTTITNSTFIFSHEGSKLAIFNGKAYAAGFAQSIAEFTPAVPVNLAPSKFYNISPANDFNINPSNLPITFIWTRSFDTDNAVSYRIVLFDSLKNEVARFNANADTFYTFTQSMLAPLPKTRLFWNVEAIGGTDTIITVHQAINLDPAVPVELIAFSAFVNENSVTLGWTTATEVNNKGFEIYRSEDNNNYQLISFSEGNGTTTEQNIYSFTDAQLNPGIYYYKIRQIDFDGTTTEYKLSTSVEVTVPLVFNISQNYPNPFNPSTVISYSIPVDAFVSLKIFDVLGNEVAQLVNELKTANRYTINFDASGLSSGIYYYTISAGSFNKTMKMILIK
jgi:photosystem II stability/assembly factor-like uncharacterized protein